MDSAGGVNHPSGAAGRRRFRRGAQSILALAGAAALTAGCAASTPSGIGSTAESPTTASVPAGTSTQTITVDGLRRTFLVYRPTTLPAAQPAPLVVMIHGGGGTAAAAERSYGWDAEADSGHFVVAYPDGINRGWSVGGGCCHFTGSPTTDDDVAFIAQLVATLSRELPINPAQVYATGISEGGMMTYRLACQTTIFAAIGPDSATLLGDCRSPAPTSVIHIHGTADSRIPYDGSAGSGVHRIHGPAIPALNTTWRTTDHCGPPLITGSGTVTTSTAACADSRGVVLITVDGAGHQWPGATCNLRCATGTADPPSTALDATQTIWQFFSAHTSR
jgi:polyhydroxybutyrate depolymerase